tara:strand:+ start:242 stop:607 length:366 start_codon:yes stop_codon:yes gene_type:complete
MGLEVKGKMIKRGEEVSDPEKKEEEVQINPADYSCEVLLEKTTPETANDKKLPSDAFNVFYVVEGEERLDVTRSGKMANVFDFYYDKYGNVKKIDYGQGTVNPSQWGYKSPEKEKKVRKRK